MLQEKKNKYHVHYLQFELDESIDIDIRSSLKDHTIEISTLDELNTKIKEYEMIRDDVQVRIKSYNDNMVICVSNMRYLDEEFEKSFKELKDE